MQTCLFRSNLLRSTAQVLHGKNFGPDVSTNLYHVTYHNPEASNKAGDLYEPICTMTVPHEEIRCEVLPGCGTYHIWRIEVGNQTDEDREQTNTMTSYYRPMILGIDSKSKYEGFNTRGTEFVTISGRHFGPVDPSNVVTAVYSNVDAVMRNKERISNNERPHLAGASFLVTCSVTTFDIEVTCGTAIGVGSNLTWIVELGDQQSDLSLDFTTYTRPNIQRICSPLECEYTPGGKPLWFLDDVTSTNVPTGK